MRRCLGEGLGRTEGKGCANMPGKEAFGVESTAPLDEGVPGERGLALMPWLDKPDAHPGLWAARRGRDLAFLPLALDRLLFLDICGWVFWS